MSLPNNWRCVRTLEGHSGPVVSVAFSPNGQILASSSSDTTIKLWNPNTGKEFHTLKGHLKSVNSITISPDGQTLASGSTDATIKVWNLSTGKEIYTLTGHLEYVNLVAISPDGKTLASASEDTTIKLWNLSTGEGIHTLKWACPQKVYYFSSLVFSLDGRILISSTWDDAVSLSAVAWNLTSGEQIWSKDWKEMDEVHSIAISPDGQTFASSHVSRRTIKLWKIYTGEEIYTLTKASNSDPSLAFSPDGQVLASGGLDFESDEDDRGYGTIYLWNLNSREKICTLNEHSEAVYSIAFSPDGYILASGSDDKTIKIWQRE
ncbi:WD40 repeat domain-containing protein [Argonema antarcticum]|uniref:WD40 repeat domain-containing protein n=1 Tax=Argonema antarcticum TaxID=2942763 RepID=UPI0020123EC6|nr:WD40 repeat domain-containing protein [Argonema antarcticum]MCL1471423.1 WD40 repeat domain-containing protein [Argonema antarcticum A004/B2]